MKSNKMCNVEEDILDLLRMTEPFYSTEQTICRARIVLLSTGFFNQFLKMSCVHYRVSAKPVCLFGQMDPQIMN